VRAGGLPWVDGSGEGRCAARPWPCSARGSESAWGHLVSAPAPEAGRRLPCARPRSSPAPHRARLAAALAAHYPRFQLLARDAFAGANAPAAPRRTARTRRAADAALTATPPAAGLEERVGAALETLRAGEGLFRADHVWVRGALAQTSGPTPARPAGRPRSGTPASRSAQAARACARCALGGRARPAQGRAVRLLTAGAPGRRVSRVLLGEPGMTYRYKGLRLFARPWRAPPGEPEVSGPRCANGDRST